MACKSLTPGVYLTFSLEKMNYIEETGTVIYDKRSSNTLTWGKTNLPETHPTGNLHLTVYSI